MTTSQLVATIVSILIVPFLVQAIKTEAMTGNVARWAGIGVSVAAGIITGFAGGVPANAGDWATCIFAVVGGVQLTYTAFKSVGITSKWLDALLNVGKLTVPEQNEADKLANAAKQAEKESKGGATK